MDIGALSSSGASLLDMLERLRAPQSGSTGPSPVPDALAREFERLMEQPPETQDSDILQPRAASGTTPAEQRPAPEDGLRIDAADSVMAEPVPAVPMLFSPEQLYHLQFLTSMLRIQVESVSKVSQQTAQGFDSLLRAQS